VRSTLGGSADYCLNYACSLKSLSTSTLRTTLCGVPCGLLCGLLSVDYFADYSLRTTLDMRTAACAGCSAGYSSTRTTLRTHCADCCADCAAGHSVSSRSADSVGFAHLCTPLCTCLNIAPLSLCLSVSLSLCLSVSLSLFLAVSLSLCLCLSPSLSVSVFLVSPRPLPFFGRRRSAPHVDHVRALPLVSDSPWQHTYTHSHSMHHMPRISARSGVEGAGAR
jgi:hypothetical protein